MIKVLFFAQIREIIGVDSLNIDFCSGSIADLIQQLSQNGDNWQLALQDKTVLCAANKVLTNKMYQIQNGDEIAFFPPVTGG